MIGRLILGAMVAVAAIFGYPDEAQVGSQRAAATVAANAAQGTSSNGDAPQ